MTSTLEYLLGDLSDQKRIELALDLFLKVSTEESFEATQSFIDILAELYHTDCDLSSVTDQIFLYCIDRLNDETSTLKDVISLYSQIPDLSTRITGFVKEITVVYLQNSSLSLLPSFKPFLSFLNIHQEQKPEISKELVIRYLTFAYDVLLQNSDDRSKTRYFAEMDELFLVLQGDTEFDIASCASKCIGLRINQYTESVSLTELIWNCIFGLVESPFDTHHGLGFILWLRWTTNCDVLNNEYFQDLIKHEKYWVLLQVGLVGKSYDQRKYSIHIISRTVQNIKDSFETEIMKWDTANKNSYLEEWKRYATLVDIVAIDTSINQTEAAVDDLLKLLNPKSLIHISWGTCLVSTGLNASQDSVRKYIAQVVMSLTHDNLVIFRDSSKFLVETYFPYVMQAYHFITMPIKSNEYTCRHFEKLTSFIEGILKVLVDQDVDKMASSIFDLLLKQRYSFDPARISVANGVKRGVEGRRALTSATLDKLSQLFYVATETKLREETMIIIFFKIMVSGRLDTGLLPWIESFAPFAIQHAETFKLVFDEMKAIIESQLDEFDSIDLIIKAEIGSGSIKNSTLVVYSEFHYSIKKQIPIFLQNLDSTKSNTFLLLSDAILSDLTYSQKLYNDDILKELIKQSTKSAFESSIINENLVTFGINLLSLMNLADTSLKNSLYALFTPSIVNTLWNHIQSQIFEINDDIQNIIAVELKLLVLVATRSLSAITFTFEDFFNFFQVSFMKPYKSMTRTGHLIRDEQIGESFSLLSIFLKASYPKDFDIESYLGLVYKHFVAASGYSRKRICECFHKVIYLADLTENIETLADTLSGMWDALISDRLIASERSLHFGYIELILNRKILDLTSKSEAFAKVIENILNSIIIQAFARRSILPFIAKHLFDYQTVSIESKSSLFFKCEWIARIIVVLFTFLQIDDHSFKLETIMGKIYHEYTGVNIYLNTHGLGEEASRAYAIGMVARLDVNIPSHCFFSKYLFNFIVSSEIYHIFVPKKRTDGNEERVRIQCYEILSLLTPFIKLEEVDSVFVILEPAIMNEPSPLVRSFIEWILTYLIFMYPSKRSFIMDNLSEPNDSPRFIGSIQRIGVLLAKELVGKEKEDYLCEIIKSIIPFCTSNRVGVRHTSLGMACGLATDLEELNFDENLELKALGEVLRHVYKYAFRGDADKQFRSGSNLLWSISQDFTLVGVCGGVLNRISDREVFFIDEETFTECFSYETSLSFKVPIGVKDISVWKKKYNPIQKRNISGSAENLNIDESSPLQTKSGAWNSVMELQSERGSQINRGKLVVIASLVDKPPNLGGICRLCDVLGAELLTLNDITVTKHPSFRSVAVTADCWMPMEEVKIKNIIPFMIQKKKEGYTLIGLEQTDKSVELNSDLKFPEKSVILLGTESEGIPGPLLAELDFCVEIKQVGVIRSMNIQTATAVIVHAYSSQHC
ncbi:hypothetical protein NADFUDRAFT_51688 [Nadsonia fulvescens var. elongata DSM 6958]|uniref:tRNA/rRNA methyltransferase SpoU type domain-containing protein n=1 Tax=Nadsonia fulvescens var. elongata DSM 6958 TaxID=857566 RepID=A0A1E3PIA2_9ASCO|nr:hypothetical protein NADFUDRAFT_51688 [Nadsonia fulvescens var. elongata DSM 6958]